jgi:AraC family transcriptional regulator of adaptative response/methylated-DNA-[protein]-cysteine methyltransferase
MTVAIEKAIGTPAVPTEHDPRWTAVLNRDPAQDGQFVYSVRTTGVYCRPTCPSRRANPQNVAFHASCEDAEKAGFRPCRRCRPTETPLAEQHAALIAKICREIETAEEPPALDALAARAGLSPFWLHRLFKSITGLTPRAYAAAHRNRRIRDQLAENSGSVTAAIYGAGFNASSRFYEASDRILGMTPTAFRDGGADTEIRFAIGQCSLGAILVGRSRKGVCAILLGDDPDALVRDLQDRFESLVARVVGLVEAPALGLDLPLDVRGTAFQQRVWQALQAIPAGETASYAEIARRIGAPRAVRAVAQACGANPIAVAIPCHRVVRNDGALSGYRWGVDRKRALLRRESQA